MYRFVAGGYFLLGRQFILTRLSCGLKHVILHVLNALGGPKGLLPLAHQNRAISESFGKSEIHGPKHFCDLCWDVTNVPRHEDSDHLRPFEA